MPSLRADAYFSLHLAGEKPSRNSSAASPLLRRTSSSSRKSSISLGLQASRRLELLDSAGESTSQIRRRGESCRIGSFPRPFFRELTFSPSVSGSQGSQDDFHVYWTRCQGWYPPFVSSTSPSSRRKSAKERADFASTAGKLQAPHRSGRRQHHRSYWSLAFDERGYGDCEYSPRVVGGRRSLELIVRSCRPLFR